MSLQFQIGKNGEFQILAKTGKKKSLFAVVSEEGSRQSNYGRPTWMVVEKMLEEVEVAEMSRDDGTFSVVPKTGWQEADFRVCSRDHASKSQAIMHHMVSSGEPLYEIPAEMRVFAMSTKCGDVTTEDDMKKFYVEVKPKKKRAPDKCKVLLDRLCKWLESENGEKCRVECHKAYASWKFDAHLVIGMSTALSSCTFNGKSHWHNLLMMWIEGSQLHTPVVPHVSPPLLDKLYPFGAVHSIEELDLKMTVAGF